MARRICLVLAGLLVSVASSVPCRAGQPQARPPNILFILIDDLGWADVGHHGGPFDTPNIDALAEKGLRLERHYVQPTCSPTRAELPPSGGWTIPETRSAGWPDVALCGLRPRFELIDRE